MWLHCRTSAEQGMMWGGTRRRKPSEALSSLSNCMIMRITHAWYRPIHNMHRWCAFIIQGCLDWESRYPWYYCAVARKFMSMCKCKCRKKPGSKIYNDLSVVSCSQWCPVLYIMDMTTMAFQPTLSWASFIYIVMTLFPAARIISV